MADLTAIENKAKLSRITLGRGQPQHDLDELRVFLRDVHSPCVARRPSFWDYRTDWLAPIRGDLPPPVPGVETDCDPLLQPQFMSDVRWLDRDALADFGRSPNAAVLPLLFADVRALIAETTSYDVEGDNAWTLVDHTGDPTPQGPVTAPTFALCLRRTGDEAAFRARTRAMAGRWAARPGVRRLRMNLFEAPDMAVAVKGPAPPHPVERQYQAMIYLQVEAEAIMRNLFRGEADDLAGFLSAAHVYPVTDTYTWNYNGRPTLAGLRGYPAYAAIKAFGAGHQADVGLLEWMYGHIVGGGPAG